MGDKRAGRTIRRTQLGTQQRIDAGQNLKVHGVYAIRNRGEDAMTPGQRTATAELRDQLTTREGVIEALKDAAVNTITLAQVAQAYCVQHHQAGVPLDQIALLRNLPAFWNSAGRALKTYLEALPDDTRAIDITEFLQGGQNDDQES